MTVCYLGIGSNLGNRRRHIAFALEKLRKLESTRVVRTSRLYETAPAGGPRGQGRFLNGAVKILTALPPLKLLKALKNIEKLSGRVKTRRWGPRVIDLDILFYGDRVVNRGELKIPHPGVFRREFVMRPLREVL